MTKLGPIEKIYEAYSAIADGRVTVSETSAEVRSSNGAKTYTITWDGNTYTSNDSASYWQGYPGYPIIAVLMTQGKVALDREVAALFAGINWTELNQQYKRDYSAAVDHIIKERGFDPAPIHTAAEKAQEELQTLDIVVKRGKLRPPKG
ncbi:MAG: hypothetical protein IJI53_10615 [Clostridia bacterium]|nr:hypothetical protein [Clostridia bacterium]